MKVAHLVPLVLGLAPVGVLAACYGATSMQVQVLTDFTCPERLQSAIYAGGDDTRAVGETSADECVARDATTATLGDLVFAPPSASERTATVTVKVQLGVGAGVDAKKCRDTPELCVFASRRFSYVEHEARRLPVRLYRDCLGKLCGADETCVAGGRCVKDLATCTGGDCSLPGGDPPFAPSPDAGTDAGAGDAGVDATVAPRCVGPDGSNVAMALSAPPELVAASAASFYWVTLAKVNTVLIHEARRSDFVEPSTPLSVAGPSATVYALATDGTKPWLAWAVMPGQPGEQAFVWNPTSQATLIGIGATSTVTAMVVRPAPPGMTTSTAYIAHESSIFKLVDNATMDSQFVPGTVAAFSALTYGGGRVFGINPASGTIPTFDITTGLSAGFVDSASATALATDGTEAFYAGTLGMGTPVVARFTSGSSSVPLARPATAPSSLDVDTGYVYWIENGAIARAPRSGASAALPGEVVVSAATAGVPLDHLHVDPGADGCVFAWGPAGDLHVWPKVP